MAIMEFTSRITRRSLMNKSKDELASQVLDLLDEMDGVRKALDAEKSYVAYLTTATDSLHRQLKEGPRHDRGQNPRHLTGPAPP